MPILFKSGGTTPPPITSVIIPQSEPQPTPLQLTYIDPDGVSWFLSDRDMTEGFICSDISGLSGVPTALSTIPMVRGGAIPQLMTPQIRQIAMGLFVQSLDNAAGQNDYLKLLDNITAAFTNLRDDLPAPGTLIVQRPDGTSRQVLVFQTSGIDQPNADATNDGMLFTSYALSLQAPDPYFYDLQSQDYIFGSPLSATTLAHYDFDDGTDGWTAGSAGGTGTQTVAQSTAFHSTGADSLVLNPDGATATPEARSPILPVAPGQVITFSGDFWCNIGLTAGAQIGFREFDAGNAFLASSYITAFNMTANTKTSKTFNYTVPSDGSVAGIEVVFRLTGTPLTTTHMYGDNIEVDNLIGFLPILPVALDGASSFGDVTVTNDGTADAYPVWTITGPGTPLIVNNTTGRSWSWDTPLNPGQVIVVNTMPGQQTAIDTSGDVNKWADLVANTPRDLWALVRGDNDVSVTFSGATNATQAEMSFLRRWLRA